ncbi:MAG TPA: DUF4157 domain-containing protein [Thermoanaerobaculia bacterium]|jgi:hypothetical protein|nr:DUF4157 domain-containing protein [Thermoanaerobaculia bacterium]
MRAFASERRSALRPGTAAASRPNHPEHPVLHLQHASGKRAVRQVLYAQPKLTVGPPGDAYEQEADRVADQVMRMPEPHLQRDCACGGKCSDCREKDHLQTKRIDETEAGEPVAPEVVHEVLRSPGQPLDTATRGFMESRFGRDFSQVRVHTDAKAAESARAVRARAFTVGRDVAFGEGQYAPQTPAGGRLLAHELTHVLHQNGVPRLQRQAGGGAAPAGAHPYSIKTDGCDVAPFVKADVEAAALAAFTAVKDTNCVKTQVLKDAILAQFDGLNIECEQGTDEPCGRAWRYFTQTVNVFASSLDVASCGPLASTILHEVVHLTERSPFSFIHGALASACEESCLPWGSGGDPSKCTYETSFVPALGVSGGLAFPRKGEPTYYARLYLGLEKRGPVLGIFHPSLGIGFGLIGESTTGEPGALPSGPSTVTSVLAGLRLDPGKPGGASLSFFGGPTMIGKARDIGAEAGVALSYRWRWFDFSLDAGYDYDPTREAGMDKFFTLGASVKIGPRVPF